MNEQRSTDVRASLIKALVFGVLGLGVHQALAWSLGAVPWIRAPEVAAALFVVLAAVWYFRSRWLEDALGHYRGLRTRLERLQMEAQEINGLTRLTDFSRVFPMPFGGGWALRGDAAALLVRELAVRKPEIIVELGSGVSTLLAAQIVARAGRGRVYSVDHDERWLAETRRLLDAAGLAEHVELIFAPLEEREFGGKRVRWYRLPETVGELERIDFLFVDGPPDLASRALAVEVLGDRVPPDGLVFLDDVDDPDMEPAVTQWSNSQFWAARRFRAGDGIAMLASVATQCKPGSSVE